MDSVNKTLYIPLYGKSLVSRKGILLHDPKAEEIWAKEGFPLKGKSKSRYLAYYMGMRSAVFDQWLRTRLDVNPGAVVLHIGCGMDSRVLRVGTCGHPWFDVDFPAVIEERKRYFTELENYHMLGTDARELQWLSRVPEAEAAIVVMEGVSMYMPPEELRQLLRGLASRFPRTYLLLDCYTSFAARASRIRNPINEVGVTKVWGVDDPLELVDGTGLCFLDERSMTPPELIRELTGMERRIFQNIYGGSLSKKLYRLYEYQSK